MIPKKEKNQTRRSPVFQNEIHIYASSVFGSVHVSWLLVLSALLRRAVVHPCAGWKADGETQTMATTTYSTYSASANLGCLVKIVAVNLELLDSFVVSTEFPEKLRRLVLFVFGSQVNIFQSWHRQWYRYQDDVVSDALSDDKQRLSKIMIEEYVVKVGYS